MFPVPCVFQVVLPGTLAVSTGLLAINRGMKIVWKFFCVFSGLVQQGHILRKPNVGRYAGGIHDYSAAVAADPRMIA